ncbi:hypothetical protein C0995_010033 [Termitomyces sp. Mi166|nr:hypothetical protein C0995_010033 [Termitomyces sp. Mi166\
MAGTGNSTPQAGDAGVIPVPQAGETPEASVYRPPHNWEESDTQNVTQQGGTYAHSTPLRPIQVMSPHTERVGDYQSVMQPTQYQASIPKWAGRGNVAASEVLQARYVPQEGKSLATGLKDQPAQESSDEEENDRSKSTLSVQLKMVLNRFPAVTKESTQKHLQLYVLKHMQMLADMGQHVPEVDSTEYIKLYIQIFELELEEYMKCKEAQATARSTATPADSVDYNAIRHQ